MTDLLGKFTNQFLNDPGSPNKPTPGNWTGQSGDPNYIPSLKVPFGGTPGNQYTRPDGTVGTRGDNGPGDPATIFAASPYAGETEIADPTVSYGADFMYGRDPNYASNMAKSALEGGNAYAQAFTDLGNRALTAGQAGASQDQGYASNQWNRGINNFAASDKLTGKETGLADSIAGSNSAAQAQLQAGLNQSEASNLALARSGRGWGQSAAGMGQAVAANAAAAQKASTDAALMRERQQEFATGVYGQAAQQAQAAGLANTQSGITTAQHGTDTNLKAQALAGQQLQTGAGEAFAGLDASKAFTDAQHNSDIQREQLGIQQYGIQSGAQTAGAALQEQHDSRIGGYIGAGIGAIGGAFVGGGVGAAPGAAAGYAAGSQISDTREKQDKAEAAGFARAMRTVGRQIGDPSVNAGIDAGNALGARVRNLGNSGAMNDPDTYQKGGGPRDQPASNFDPFAKYDQRRANDLMARQMAPAPKMDPATMNPATSSATWAQRAYGVQNPESPETYLPPASGAPAPPVGASQPWLDNYMAGQSDVTSDTEEKRNRERAAGFAEAMRTIDTGGAAQPDETTRLSPEQEADFQNWAKRSGIRDLDDPRSHYDYRGAYLAGMRPSANMHWPDTFKQHGHPTFSVESQYSAGPDDGGSWDGERYIPQRTAPRVDVDALDAAQRAQGGPVNDMRPAVGYTYQYKDPTLPGTKPGTVAGPMAQDIEHTIAADAVETGPNGSKVVNTPRLSLHNTAAIGEQQTEIEKLKAQLDALAGKKPPPARPAARVPLASAVNPRTLTRIPTASYAPVEHVPVTGEETNFRMPLGWDPDVDEAAAQQITFPGEGRTHVVYRPGTY